MSTATDSPWQSRILDLLECPVCFGYASPPIQQCSNGHIICQKCLPRLDCCPTCRCEFRDGGRPIRCLTLEKLIDDIPNCWCDFYENGCREEFKYLDKVEHQRNCDYRHCISCPIKCDWKGPWWKLAGHVGATHKYAITAGVVAATVYAFLDSKALY